MSFNFEGFIQDRLRMTDSAFAKIMDVDPSQINRWKNNPDSMSVLVIMQIMEKTGCSFEELTEFNRSVPGQVSVQGSDWEKMYSEKKVLIDFIHKMLSDEKYKSLISEIESCFYTAKVLVYGKHCAGKKTLINTMIGKQILPTAATSALHVPIIVQRCQDNRNIINAEKVQVYANNEKGERENTIVANGGLGTLMSVSPDDVRLNKISYATVYVNSDVLNYCDIIYMPYMQEQEDSSFSNTVAKTVGTRADVVIYASSTDDFLTADEVVQIAALYRSMEASHTQDNLFITASQAQRACSNDIHELEQIIQQGYNRVKSLIKDFREDRIYGYSTNYPELCATFHSSIGSTIGKLPEKANADSIRAVYDFTRKEIKRIEQEKKLHLEESEHTRKLREQNDSYQRDARIKDLQRQSVVAQHDFSDYYCKRINTDFLASECRRRDVKTRDDLVRLVSTQLDELNYACHQRLQVNRELHSDTIYETGIMATDIVVDVAVTARKEVEHEVKRISGFSEMNLAKRIVKGFENGKILTKYLELIRRYWQKLIDESTNMPAGQSPVIRLTQMEDMESLRELLVQIADYIEQNYFK